MYAIVVSLGSLIALEVLYGALSTQLGQLKMTIRRDMVDELIEYCGDVPSIDNYLMSVGCVKKQVVFPLDMSKAPAADHFKVEIRMTGVKNLDLAEMPDVDNTVNSEVAVPFTDFIEHKKDIIREMWIDLAYLIYSKKETENAITNGHTRTDQQD